ERLLLFGQGQRLVVVGQFRLQLGSQVEEVVLVGKEVLLRGRRGGHDGRRRRGRGRRSGHGRRGLEDRREVFVVIRQCGEQLAVDVDFRRRGRRFRCRGFQCLRRGRQRGRRRRGFRCRFRRGRGRRCR